MDGRSLIVSPSAYTALLATDRFTEQQFIGNGSAIATGKVGTIYGVAVYVSSNIGTGSDEKGLLFQKDALVLATQQSVRTQTQYKQEKLADLFTADCIFGTKVVRPSSIVEMRSTV
jgi:RES domain-containing protein